MAPTTPGPHLVFQKEQVWLLGGGRLVEGRPVVAVASIISGWFPLGLLLAPTILGLRVFQGSPWG